MGVARFIERVEQPFAGVRVDREKGVIYGVKLCGLTSLNGSDYSPALFARDHGKYDGAVVNFGHHLKGEPPVESVGGRVRNPKPADDGARGELHLLKSHPMYERVMEAAERDPGLFGLSHVIDADWKPGKNGRRAVEGIKRVVSVDLVSTPATTKGLFESAGMGLTLKQLAESVSAHPKATAGQKAKAKRLAEMDGLGDLPTDIAAPPEDAGEPDHDEAIWAGHKAAVEALLEKLRAGDIDVKEVMSKIKTVLNSHASVSDSGGDKSDESDDGGEGDDMGDKAKESKAPAADYPGILRECAGEQYNPTATELLALAGLPTAGDRKAFIAEQKAKVPGDTVKSAGRKPGGGSAGRVAEQVNNTPAAPKTATEFVNIIRE